MSSQQIYVSIDLALSVIDDFRIKKTRANEIIKEVVAAVSKWQTVAAQFGLRKKELDRMASAFEHEDFYKARVNLTAGKINRE